MSAAFEAENAPVSAPVSAVYFNRYSQPGSDTYIRGDMAYATVTLDNLAPGDVVYLYEDNSGMWSRCSLPVAEGETTATIDRVAVPWRGGGSLNIRVHRAGEQLSEMQTIHTPYMGTMAVLFLKAWDTQGQALDAQVVYGVYDENGEEVARVCTASEFESGRVFVPCGSYTLKCLSVPEAYEVEGPTEMKKMLEEGLTYSIDVTLVPEVEDTPQVSWVTVTPDEVEVKRGSSVQFQAKVIGTNLTDSSVTWTVTGGTSADTKISAGGWLTVGADEEHDDLVVTATSNQDPAKSMNAIVIVLPADAADTEPTMPATVPDTGSATQPGENSWVLWVVIAAVAVAAAAVTGILLKKKKHK